MMPLKVIDSRGNDITTLEQWSKTVRRSHWKQGRSAFPLADFILNRNRAAHQELRIASILSQPVRLDQATPEYAARFDRHDGPARLDLGICGRTSSGESVFVGLEAKVDEPYQGLVGAWLGAAATINLLQVFGGGSNSSSRKGIWQPEGFLSVATFPMNRSVD